MDNMLSWVATAATIGGALLTASNLGARITGTGFIVFLFGSLSWIGVSLMTGQEALLWTNIVLTFLNLFGIWRWLGRQAKVEEGGKAAAQASEHTPGEALFPVSLLSRAEVLVGGRDAGTCVDAMAGESSGRIAYVVVTEGGVAGVGERLFKLPWRDARMSGERLIADHAQRLEEVEKDEWPGR
ncbi:PRC-barrel domain containing protein [Sphingomonas alba]|uniref:PRC-barrel domain containing protein n=1 Tax=Sphingomonas alba TaxID=2908208 RepID=A0ABT0RJ48_9SPHN|nr:PRC-barrel domain containing protein [Sphingomonas alba]MCL6682603.1 PRC-barrel domain containing protein [Sphingomonas alba]